LGDLNQSGKDWRAPPVEGEGTNGNRVAGKYRGVYRKVKEKKGGIRKTISSGRERIATKEGNFRESPFQKNRKMGKKNVSGEGGLSFAGVREGLSERGGVCALLELLRRRGLERGLTF